jgi:pyruvate dehydrogenase E2 component (dihydrolipoamide acetyltransferase)
MICHKRRDRPQKEVFIKSLTPGPDGIIGLREIEPPAALMKPGAGRGINFDEMREAIAAAMARSKREIPHYCVSSIIGMTPTMDWLAAENARRAVPDRILATTAVIKACAHCLQQVPELNGHYAGDCFSQIAEAKMEIGIALRGGGLIAPALPSPDTMSLGEIMERLRDLAARVRGGRLRSSELTGATITFSSLGDDSADLVLPVIYPPQVAIIGVGQVVERSQFVDGAIAVRKVATFAVAGDHRANDGPAPQRGFSIVWARCCRSRRTYDDRTAGPTGYQDALRGRP